MLPKEDPQEFYSRFHQQLTESQEWPGSYMFKFIVRTESSHLDDLKALFSAVKPHFSEKQSAKKNFVSLSVTAFFSSPNQIIDIYKLAKKFKGVITL